MSDDGDDRPAPFTFGERRRTDRLERAVMGYADEAGVWVPGVLTTLSSWHEDTVRWRHEDAEERARVRADLQKRQKLILRVAGGIFAFLVTNFSIVSGALGWITAMVRRFVFQAP